MTEAIFKLDRSFERPTIKLSSNMLALLDTGAYIPVWTDDVLLLKEFYHATLQKERFEFSGFGGKTYGDLYRVHFTMGKLSYPAMPIIASAEFADAPFSVILSATMLHGLIYEIDTINGFLKIQAVSESDLVRNITVFDKKGQKHILAKNDFFEGKGD